MGWAVEWEPKALATGLVILVVLSNVLSMVGNRLFHLVNGLCFIYFNNSDGMQILKALG